MLMDLYKLLFKKVNIIWAVYHRSVYNELINNPSNINTKLIPNNINIIAHILSHEWGHHVLRHMTIEPNSFKTEEFDAIQEKENEADLYAANFIKEYSYDVNNIKDFMREQPGDLENRLNILQSVY